MTAFKFNTDALDEHNRAKKVIILIVPRYSLSRALALMKLHIVLVTDPSIISSRLSTDYVTRLFCHFTDVSNNGKA